MQPNFSFCPAPQSFFLAASKMCRGGGMLFSLLLLLSSSIALSGQDNCDNFEFLVEKQLPVGPPWSYGSPPFTAPDAYHAYYRVYIKTVDGSNLPLDYSFNHLLFTGKVSLPNFPYWGKLNKGLTQTISTSLYPQSPNVYWQYINSTTLSESGQVDWEVGSPAAGIPGCPTTTPPVPLQLGSNSNPGTRDRVLLFVIALDEIMVGDKVDFNASGQTLDCSCDLNGFTSIQGAPWSFTMPAPSNCAGPTISFLPIDFNPTTNSLFIPVELSGLSIGTGINKMDGVIHVVPKMNSIAQLQLIPILISTPGQLSPPGLSFSTRKNSSDGSFDIYFSTTDTWTPTVGEVGLFGIKISGLFNLSQGACFQLHLSSGRMSTNGTTCLINGVDAEHCLPGCAPPPDKCRIETGATIDPSTCAMAVDYKISHDNPTPLELDYLHLDFRYNKVGFPPSSVNAPDLPCPACWTDPAFDPAQGAWVISYTYDASVQGGGMKLPSLVQFQVDFPGQDACFEPFVYYAEGKLTGSNQCFALETYINVFPVCDPRVNVALFNPNNSSGFGVDDFKTTLEGANSYLQENDETCKIQHYCPDLSKAPFTVTASTVNNNPLCGVSTFDLVRMSKHILNVPAFTLPSQFVAADINKNGVVTTFDVVELRKLILGIYSDFPSNQSWHYVDDAWAFPPLDPLEGTPPPYIPFYDDKNIIKNVQSGSSLVFKAIKVGDLTGDCNCGTIPLFKEEGAENRNLDEGKEADWLSIPTEQVKRQPSGLVSIPVFANGREAWLGLQSGFRFDPAYFEFVSVSPNIGAGINMGNFGLGKTANGEIRFSWSFSDPDALLASNEWLFTVQLRKRVGRNELDIKEWLSLDNAIMKSEAYANQEGEASVTELQLKWEAGQNTVSSTAGLSVHAAPNPFKQAASTVFINAITPGSATIELTDLNGKTVSSQQADLQIGENRVQLNGAAEKLPTGTYLLVVQQNGQRAHQRIVKI